MDPFSLKGKNIIITGASSGIGRTCAISCSKMGANVILVARNKERLNSLFAKLEKGYHLNYCLDVTKYDQIEPLISDAVCKVGKISGFIHSAGLELTMPLKMLKPKHYEETFAVNVFSGFEFIKILTRKKYLGENASFIIISSIMGLLGQKGISVYSSSKGAIVNGIKSLALELADKYIRVNSIAPAIVKTEMTQNLFSKMSENNMKEIEKMHPLGFGETEDVANACIYLLSDASKWITGTNLIIDGGYSAQ